MLIISIEHTKYLNPTKHRKCLATIYIAYHLHTGIPYQWSWTVGGNWTHVLGHSARQNPHGNDPSIQQWWQLKPHPEAGQQGPASWSSACQQSWRHCCQSTFLFWNVIHITSTTGTLFLQISNSERNGKFLDLWLICRNKRIVYIMWIYLHKIYSKMQHIPCTIR